MTLTWDAVCKRAGGRRRYNSVRRLHAVMRQRDVLDYWRESRGRHGWQAEAATALGVHRSTITRDVQALLDIAHRGERCPLCGRHQ